MKNKEKGSFFGFTSVFSFTAKQNMKGKERALHFPVSESEY